ncbi:MAG: hypothetical protein Q7R66_07535 [Undibacterium sp.]|uniref:hypothetical protein n=1 Tax=Undibacterium sp. TaxID=1914977 RepID=UPI00271CBF2B|nr:hypothetical protein [Undibacterium sp.]MDO8652024.1 hypothetical protein [Undibacterium sp.]
MNQKQIAVLLGIARAIGITLEETNFPKQNGKHIDIHMKAKHATMQLMEELAA